VLLDLPVRRKEARVRPVTSATMAKNRGGDGGGLPAMKVDRQGANGHLGSALNRRNPRGGRGSAVWLSGASVWLGTGAA
jgi:hypothetical protein